MFSGNLQIEYINGDKWRVINPKGHFLFQYNEYLIIPSDGFKTDLASIPRAFWALLPPSGKYAPAAVIHDYMIYCDCYPKKVIDKAFREAMRCLNVSFIKREVIYLAVKLFGKY